MKSLLGGSPLFRRILASILLACVLFLSLLSLIVYYSNEILEDALLARQSDFELSHIRQLLAQNPDASLPRSASLSIYLASRQDLRPIPDYLTRLEVGAHHDIKIGGRAYHVLVAPWGEDRIFIRHDITEIEKTEELLYAVLFSAWVTLIVLVFILARIVSKKLSEPIAELSDELSRISPEQRGIKLGQRFGDDEVGKIAAAFDSYSEKMDHYVEKQMAFAAMASHELRSPLTIVQTSADLIASRSRDGSITPQLEKIERAAANMANLIHALLAVTRDTPAADAVQSVSLRPLVEEILDAMGPEISAKQLRIDNRLTPADQVHADPALLLVVLTNLIRNAVKHSDRNSIEIGMTGATLSIIDHGIGIDEATLQDIFDFGFRGSNSQGYGVGLYISKLVCDYLDWELVLRPGPEGGIIASVGFSR